MVQVFEEEGITFGAEPSWSHVPSPRSTVVATLSSPPLAEIVEPILTDSNNWLAEMLLRLLALELAGEGRLDTGLELLGAFLEETVGAEAESFVLDDASGLSPFNLLTPSVVVQLLQFSWQQPWREVLVGALTSGSRGTLARGWPRLPPVVGKTGTLRGTQTLAGVLDPRAEEPIFFAVFLNHRGDGRHALRAEIARLLWEWFKKGS